MNAELPHGSFASAREGAAAPAEGVSTRLAVDEGHALGALRGALIAAGYEEGALVDIAGARDGADGLDVQAAARRTTEPSALNTLVRLFLLRHVVPAPLAAAALAPAEIEPLAALRLLQVDEDGVRSTASLLPHDGLFVASDFGLQVAAGPLRPDHVLGVGAASATLANLTVRRAVDSVLDLGTGSGIQAMLAARHARRVVGTDLNPRALRLAALNLGLNGTEGVDLRLGSLYEPVAGERFDLIVANPPFIISPERRYAYRDGGLPGDELSEQVIRSAPARLAENGYAVVLFNWHHRNADDWAARPKEWVSERGCDAWLVRFKTSDPLSYAANWLRQTEGRDAQRYGRLLDEWLDYYARLELGMFSAGAMFLRRRTAAGNWVRADTVAGGRPAGSCGAQVERVFAGQDLAERLVEADALLDHAFALAPDHELQHRLHAENGSWVVKEALLKQTRGFEFAGEVDRVVAAVLGRCDGRRPLRDVLAEVARQAGVRFDDVVSPCGVVVRWLLQLGFFAAPAAATPVMEAA